MENLLQETLDMLKEHNKNFDDVIAIFGDDFQITKENFIKVADKEYDEGYGAPEVATDLKILGNDFIMKRYDYDGAEWWEYITFNNELPKKFVEVKSVITNKTGWNTLEEISKQESEEK